MSGDQRLCSGFGDRLCRLYTSTLCCVQVLLVADNLERIGLEIIEEKIASPSEARIEWGIDVFSRSGENQFHLKACPV